MMEQEHVFFFSQEEFNIDDVINPITHQFESGSNKGVMEETLEKVRKEQYPQCPSRLFCTFVAPTEISANEWLKAVKHNEWKYQGSCLVYYIYELAPTGNILWYYADILMQQAYAKWKTNVDIAKEYWASCSLNKPNCSNIKYEGIAVNPLYVVNKNRMSINPKGIYTENSYD